MPDQKNLILAIMASILILVGFQYFFGPEPVDTPPTTQQEAGQPATAGAGSAVGTGGTVALPGEPAAPTATLTRSAAVAEGPRVRIDTPSLHGSLSLVGGRLDDLTLANYHLTPDPTSPEIILLSPRTAPDPYYADFGWAATDAGVATPTGETVWTADSDLLTPDSPVTLRWDNGAGLTFEREIAVDQDYMFTVTLRATNTGSAPVTLSPYGRVLRFGEPDLLNFFILHEGPYGVLDGTLEEYSYDDLMEEADINQQTTGGWLGFTDKYWLVALAPDQQSSFDAGFSHRADGPLDRYFATYRATETIVQPGETAETTTHLFAGAKAVQLMDRYSEELGIEKFDLTIDFGWFYFLTKPMFYALAFIHSLVGNFGIAILVLTVFIKLLFFPLANKSYKSMSRMKGLQPEMVKLRERFGDDRQKLNAEMMALYKREKVNPAAGCLPILVQIPVFFALYKVLFVTIEMRHAPFFGWIQDLSAPDPTSLFNLFGLIPWTPPEFLLIGIWPLIMGLTMFLQQKLNPAPADPIQAKIFMALPIVFTFMLARFPAGLVIYWAWNNSLSILQQWIIMRRMGVKIGGGVDPVPAAPPPSAKRKKSAADASSAPSEPDAGDAPKAQPAAAQDKPTKPANKRRKRAGGGRKR